MLLSRGNRKNVKYLSRAEMLRCCAPEETGKMFAMLSSVESLGTNINN